MSKNAGAEAQGESATEKLKAYYESTVRKLGADEPPVLDDSIVRCRLPSGEQYLRRYDCDLRGGQVASGSRPLADRGR